MFFESELDHVTIKGVCYHWSAVLWPNSAHPQSAITHCAYKMQLHNISAAHINIKQCSIHIQKIMNHSYVLVIYVCVYIYIHTHILSIMLCV